MLSNEKQAIQVFRRVRDFLAENAPPVGYGTVARLVDHLTGVIDRLEAHASDQDARSRRAEAGTRTKRLLSVMIRREFLRPVARAARALFPHDEALLSALAMPRVRDYQGTIAAAEGMAKSASAHRAQFLEAGFPDDFVERMQQAAADLRAAMDAHAVEFGKRAAATAGLRREYARGRDLVRVLDAMVAPRLEAAPGRLAEWRTISHFARQGAPSGETEVESTDSASAPPRSFGIAGRPVIAAPGDDVRAA